MMKRRKFLSNAATGLPILLLSQSILASACNREANVDPQDINIFIIGAGISGLAAAKKLKEKGFNVTILESQDRIGGRTRTNRTIEVPFDEGASWIHGINGNPITSLAEQAGMETFHTVDDQKKRSYDIGGVLRPQALYQETEDAYYAMLETLSSSGNAAQSFETVFNNLYPTQANDRLWKFFLSTYLTFDCGDLNNLSSLLYNEGEEFNGLEKIATNGYDKIPEFLATGLNVVLNQRVSKIDYTNPKIEITHNGTVSEADFVVVTVPLGVLKANAIQFIPALPVAKQTAIERVGMNCINKFLLTWDTAFWDDVQYFSYTPEVKDKFNYFVNVNKYKPNANALMTFAYADYARQTETMTDAQVIEEIMLHLKDIYGSAIPNPTNLLRTKWQANENTFGSYSYTAVGTEMQHFDDLADAVNSRVFFAGEHTSVDYFSTVHGAYLSGIREADKIIDLF